MNTQTKKQLIKYLEGFKVLIQDNADMEDIIGVRDQYYAEDDKVDELIKEIEKL